MKNLPSVDLIKSCDSLDPNLRYVEGQSQYGLNDVLQQKPPSDSIPPCNPTSNQSIPSLWIEKILFRAYSRKFLHHDNQ